MASLAGGDVTIDILGNARPLQRAMGGVRSILGSMNTLAVGALAGATAAFAGLKKVIGESLEAYGKQQQAEMRLSQALKDTGGVVGFTAEQLKAQAAALQENSIYGDEAIIGMQTLGMTFDNVRGKAFAEMEKAVVNLSSRLGTDLNSNMRLVGKALNDPIKGMTQLEEAVGTLDASVKQQIITLTESGKVEEAQMLMLSKFSGMQGEAAAVAKSFSGQMQQLKNEIGDKIFEAVGQKLAPDVERFMAVLKDMLPTLQIVFSEVAGGFVEMIKGVWDWITNVFGGVDKFKELLIAASVYVHHFADFFVEMFADLAAKFLDFINALAAPLRWAGIDVELFKDTREMLHNISQAAGDDISSAMKDAFKEAGEVGKQTVKDVWTPDQEKVNSQARTKGTSAPGSKTAGGGGGGGFVGLEAAWGNLASATLKANPVENAVKEQTEVQKKTLEVHKETLKTLKQIDEKTKPDRLRLMK